MVNPRKVQTRFTQVDDVVLVKESLAHSPFTDRSRWAHVAVSVTDAIGRPRFTVDARRVRKRVKLLMEQWRKTDREGLQSYYNTNK